MNLQELIAKASSLPWKSARSHEDKNGPMFELDPGEIKPITQIYGREGETVVTAHDCFTFKDEDAALITHCVNNFPEMVKALREAVSLLNYIATHPRAWETIHGRAVDTRATLTAALTTATTIQPVNTDPKS